MRIILSELLVSLGYFIRTVGVLALAVLALPFILLSALSNQKDEPQDRLCMQALCALYLPVHRSQIHKNTSNNIWPHFKLLICSFIFSACLALLFLIVLSPLAAFISISIWAAGVCALLLGSSIELLGEKILMQPVESFQQSVVPELASITPFYRDLLDHQHNYGKSFFAPVDQAVKLINDVEMRPKRNFPSTLLENRTV